MTSHNLLARIASVKMFLLDLDGTVYRGDHAIPGAYEFIEILAGRKIPYVFLTNNSSKSANDYLRKLKRLGFPVRRENILTSGQATGMHIAHRKPGARVFVAGTRSLKRELYSCGLCVAEGREGADFVVAGFDTELTYAKIAMACRLVDAGVPYIATNPDLVCPIEGGRSIPDCGSICFMIEKATGRRPVIIGKPKTAFARLACHRFEVPASRAAMVGDRLYTDIAMGRGAKMTTIAVLTGETSRGEIRRSGVKPDIVVDSVADITTLLRAYPKTTK